MRSKEKEDKIIATVGIISNGGLETWHRQEISRGRGKGRVRELRMDSLKEWLEDRRANCRKVELIGKAREREVWNSMVAKVYRYDV